MEKVTTDRFSVDFGNRTYLYKAKDVSIESDCGGCDLSVGATSIIVEEKLFLCDKYACTPCLRGDKRNVVFVKIKKECLKTKK